MPPHTTATAIPGRERRGPEAGRPMDLRLLAALGERRDEHLAGAETILDRAVGELVDAGPKANIALAAKLVGVSRDTLYSRLERRRAAA